MQPGTAYFYGTPSEHQARRIQQIVSRRETELAQIDNDILRVRALLQQLLHDREDIRESLEAHKAMIIPPQIRALERIPPEIWALIFMACMEDAWTSGHSRIDITKPPLLLCRICSSWSDIALSQPSLWASICIPRSTRASAIPLIEAWLQRSADMPLSIEIHGLSSEFPAVLLETFIPHSSRWQNVSLFMSNTTLAELFANPQVSLSSLETLMLRISGRPQYMTITASATRLQSVALVVSRSVRPDPHMLDLPWVQLTRLSITSLAGAIDDGYDILTQCIKLTHCSLSADRSIIDPVSHPPITLPNLTSLQIVTNRDPGNLLDSLILPRLLQFEIDFVDLGFNTDIWPKSQTISLLTRVPCQLQSLIIRNKTIPESDLVDCCRHMPSLVHLLVTGSGDRHGPVQTLELLRATRSEQQSAVAQASD